MYNASSGRITSFDNISQRVLYMPTRFFAPFRALDNIPAGHADQQTFYSVLRNILGDIYNDPGLLNISESADRSYPWWLCNNQDPETDALFKAVFKETSNFYGLLFYSAVDGQIDSQTKTLAVRISDIRKRNITSKNYHIKLLEKHGIDCEIKGKKLYFSPNEKKLTNSGNNLCYAWKALAESCVKRADANKMLTGDAALFSFVTGNFDCDYTGFANKIEALSSLEPNFFDAAEKFYDNAGYTKNLRLDFNRNGISVCCRWQGSVSGFNISYQPRKAEQIFFSINNGIGMKKMMEDFKSMPGTIQEYFVSAAKKCDGCLGCTKGGKATIFRVSAEYNGEEIYFCPQFPNLHFFDMNSEILSLIMSINELQSKYR